MKLNMKLLTTYVANANTHKALLSVVFLVCALFASLQVVRAYDEFDYGYGDGFGEPGSYDIGYFDDSSAESILYDDYGYGEGAGESGEGCCDVEYEDVVYDSPETNQIAYSPVEYAPYEYVGADYAPYVYTGYTYNPVTYTPVTYNPVTYNPVTYDPVVYTPVNYPTCTLSASDSSIDDGDETTLEWTTTHADDVSLSDGIGDVDYDGEEEVSPNETTTYSLLATNEHGSVWCTETVYVDEDEDDNDNDDVSCDAFSASDTRVEEGDRVTLTWRTTGARDVEINHDVGDVDDDGSERVTIDETTTFTLTARDGSDTDTCRVTVRVEDEDDEDTNADAPRCRLTISDTKINAGEAIVVSWNNLGTDRVVLRDNHNSKIADSNEDSRINEDTGALTLRPLRDTTYTLTAYNDDEKRTCTVSTDVVAGGVINNGIQLSQVPYTGFEAGKVLTILFYALIVLWGLVVGYVLVLRKKNVVPVHGEFPVTPADSGITAFEVSAETSTEVEAPADLPEVEEIPLSVKEESLYALETHAHAKSVLISSDALRFIEGQGGTLEDQIQTLDKVIALSKARYPQENGWTVLNRERVQAVLS